jgi:VIT1/CCC1 family predicted Fe2+/Mn2+ transporter
VLYLMACLGEKGHDLAVYRAVRAAPSLEHARQLIANALPSVVASALDPAALDQVRRHVLELPEPPERARLSAADWKGAFAVFLLVFLSTLPVVAPFLLMPDAVRALRFSNAIAIAMLFAAGVNYGRHAGHSPWLVGVSMVLLGSILVAMTIALGG